MTNHILRIDASMRRAGSTSRQLSDELIEALAPDTITTRDLADGIALINEDWINANFTDPAQRTDAQKQTLAGSDALVEEVEAADTLVIGVPIYNFGVPAALKAWIDQIARAKRTFKYTENGPVGLLEGKTAWLVIASGGTASGSDIDFATGYMRHVLGFVGITDVHVIDASKQGAGAEGAIARARAAIPAPKAA